MGIDAGVDVVPPPGSELRLDADVDVAAVESGEARFTSASTDEVLLFA